MLSYFQTSAFFFSNNSLNWSTQSIFRCEETCCGGRHFSGFVERRFEITWRLGFSLNEAALFWEEIRSGLKIWAVCKPAASPRPGDAGASWSSQVFPQGMGKVFLAVLANPKSVRSPPWVSFKACRRSQEFLFIAALVVGSALSRAAVGELMLCLAAGWVLHPLWASSVQFSWFWKLKCCFCLLLEFHPWQQHWEFHFSHLILASAGVMCSAVWLLESR